MSVTVTLLDLLSNHILGVILVLVIFLLALHYFNQPSNLPPGPPSLPIIGALPFLIGRGYLHNIFTSWRKKYGDVFCLQMGNQLIVVLNSFESIKEAYVKNGDAVSGRVKSTIQPKEFANAGIVTTDGVPWKEQRRFTLSTLRDFGMGKSSLESKIHEEIEYLTMEMKKKVTSPFDTTFSLNSAISNIICSITFGQRFEYHDEAFLEKIDILNSLVKNGHRMRITERMPGLKYLPGDLTRTTFVSTKFMKICDWVASSVQDHISKYDPHNVLDVIDAFLKQKENNAKDGNTHSHITEQNLPRLIFELFAAGTETTSTSLRWALLYMALYPDVQKRVRSEIEELLGRNRLPSMQDKVNLPYTEAVIQEISRIGSIAPLSVPHRCTSAFTLNGYTIPQNAMVFSNLYAVHHDPNNFQDPFVFKPERFLSDDGQKVTKADFLIPFGIGRRSCLGESLARMELFLVFGALMQRFEWRFADGANKPDPLQGIGGGTLSPPTHELCAIYRNTHD